MLTAECEGKGAAVVVGPVGIELDRLVESATGIISTAHIVERA